MSPEKLLDLIVLKANVISNNEYLKLLGEFKEVSTTLKMALSIPDRLFKIKIEKFLKGLDLTTDERLGYSNVLSGNPNKLSKTGLMLFELIEKSDTEAKSEIIGRLFSDYVRKKYHQSIFIRYSQMIIAIYADELKYFLHTSENNIEETSDQVEHLLSVGVYTRVYGEIGFGGSINPQKQPRLSASGKAIRKILSDF
jgi:hypothetical protein